MKDASAMIIEGAMESDRLNNLDIAIPLPQELPVLTTSQLLEMERRLGDLMSRLEDEIQRAEAEVKRRKEQEFEMEKREAVMHSNRFGRWSTNDEWTLQMRNRIEQRLHRRHGFGDTPALPSQKANLDSTLNSPFARRAKPPAFQFSDTGPAFGHASENTYGGGGRAVPVSGLGRVGGSIALAPSNPQAVGVSPTFVAFED